MSSLKGNLEQPFKKGQTVSASRLEAMRQAVHRQIAGGGTTNVEQLGDLLLVKSTDPGPRNSDISSYIARFVVVQEFDNYLKCAAYQQPNDGSNFSPLEYDSALGSTASYFTYIAKPWMLQRRFWDGKTINGISYAWTAIGERTANSNLQKAKYAAGEPILAAIGVTGLTGPDGIPIGWIDLNSSGLSYSSEGGDGSYFGDTINIIDSVMVSIASGKSLTIQGPGIVVFNAPLTICGYWFMCSADVAVTANQELDNLVIPVDGDGKGVPVIRITGTGPWAITGITSVAAGQVLAIQNCTAQAGALAHLSSSSAVGKKLAMPGSLPLTILANGGVILRYDSDGVWQCLSVEAGGFTGSVTYVSNVACVDGEVVGTTHTQELVNGRVLTDAEDA